MTTGVVLKYLTGRTPNQHGQSIVVPLFTNKPTRLINTYQTVLQLSHKQRHTQYSHSRYYISRFTPVHWEKLK